MAVSMIKRSNNKARKKPMDKYWKNGSGCYDPTAARAIEQMTKRERKARNKEVHDTIMEIKNILSSRGMETIGRLEIRDKITGKEYK